MRRKTPQEKKALSLKKDRRNTYGENEKASRIGIPKAKSRVNRANRHLDRQRLGEATGGLDAQAAAAVEDRVLGRRRKVWRKVDDQRLGEVLALKATRESSRSGNCMVRTPSGVAGLSRALR